MASHGKDNESGIEKNGQRFRRWGIGITGGSFLAMLLGMSMSQLFVAGLITTGAGWSLEKRIWMFGRKKAHRGGTGGGHHGLPGSGHR